ncbi:MAG: hypothetical protein M1318_06085 [Firmicutes bacterium]|nr:hypothetical protein [Bacillota bacterium]
MSEGPDHWILGSSASGMTMLHRLAQQKIVAVIQEHHTTHIYYHCRQCHQWHTAIRAWNGAIAIPEWRHPDCHD